MQAMTSAPAASRLDRLLALLQSGPSEAARLAAGRQLGLIQREHPRQLHTLLQRVLRYLFHEQWETRRAAVHALEAIADAVTTWVPGHPDEENGPAEAAARDEAAGAWLSFERFDIERVLSHGAPLLASGGQEYEVELANERPHERLLRQKALLQEQLGLETIGNAIGGREQRDMMDLIKPDDLDDSGGGGGRGSGGGRGGGGGGARSGGVQQAAAAQLIAEQLAAASGGAAASARQGEVEGADLSERGRNTLKRKARQAAKGTYKGAAGADILLPRVKRARWSEVDGGGGCAPVDDDEDGRDAMGMAASAGSSSSAVAAALAAASDEAEMPSRADAEEEVAVKEEEGEEDVGEWERSDEWPFEALCAELRCSLFHPRWQVKSSSVSLWVPLIYSGSSLFLLRPFESI